MTVTHPSNGKHSHSLPKSDPAACHSTTTQLVSVFSQRLCAFERLGTSTCPPFCPGHPCRLSLCHTAPAFRPQRLSRAPCLVSLRTRHSPRQWSGYRSTAGRSEAMLWALRRDSTAVSSGDRTVCRNTHAPCKKANGVTFYIRKMHDDTQHGLLPDFQYLNLLILSTVKIQDFSPQLRSFLAQNVPWCGGCRAGVEPQLHELLVISGSTAPGGPTYGHAWCDLTEPRGGSHCNRLSNGNKLFLLGTVPY